MAKADPIQTAFNAGEWSTFLEGRVDLDGYPAACYRSRNIYGKIQGPAIRRGGSKHIRQQKANSKRGWIKPFVRSRSIKYGIEFGDSICRFYFDRALVLTGSPVTITAATKANPIEITTSGAHGYSDGQDVFISGSDMAELNGRWFTVANAASTTFELQDLRGNDIDGSGYAAAGTSGSVDKPYEIASPYSEAALVNAAGGFNLDIEQSGDVLYIADRSGALMTRKLSRTSSTSWAFSTLDPDTGPFLDLNDSDATMYISHASGSGRTVTSSTSVFTAGHVGALLKIEQSDITVAPWKTGESIGGAGVYRRSGGREYVSTGSGSTGSEIPSHTKGTVSDGGVSWTYVSPGYGVARITSQSGTTATVDVLVDFPQPLVGSGNPSVLWRLGAWSEAEGYPTTVALFDSKNRLCFGKGRRVDMSVAGSYEDFSPDEFGEVAADSAVSRQVRSDIVAMIEARKSMLLFREDGVSVVGPLTPTEPFGPGNVDVDPVSSFGSRPIPPIRVGNKVLQVQSAGQKVREAGYALEVDDIDLLDMLVRSEDVALPAIVGTTFQQETEMLMWSFTSDGRLLNFSYDPTQAVRGWAQHPLGGVFGEGAPVVEDVMTLPSPDGKRDEVWLGVKRTIDGETVRYWEYITEGHGTNTAQADCFFVDCGATYDGAAATEIYGFDHLEGRTARIMADGARHPDKVVSGGKITLDYAAEKVHAGEPMPWVLATMRVEAGSQIGTAQGKTKKMGGRVRVLDTFGVKGGFAEGKTSRIPELNDRSTSTPMGQPEPLKTGDFKIDANSGWQTEGRVWLEGDDVFPVKIIAVMPRVNVSDAQ